MEQSAAHRLALFAILSFQASPQIPCMNYNAVLFPTSGNKGYCHIAYCYHSFHVDQVFQRQQMGHFNLSSCNKVIMLAKLPLLWHSCGFNGELMSSSVSVLFHTSFPSPTLGWKPSGPGDLLWEFLSSWFPSLGMPRKHFQQGSSWEHPALKHQCVIKSFKKAKGLGREDLTERPLAQAFQSEGNRAAASFSASQSTQCLEVVRSRRPRELWADGRKHKCFETVIKTQAVSRPLNEFTKSRNLKGIHLYLSLWASRIALAWKPVSFLCCGRTQQCLQLPLTSSRKSLMKNAWLLIISFLCPIVVAHHQTQISLKLLS